MDLSDLRLAALNRAANDTRTDVNGQVFHALPEVITARATAYLKFLLSGMPDETPKPKAVPKKRR
jgi:hypothetical protein